MTRRGFCTLCLIFIDFKKVLNLPLCRCFIVMIMNFKSCHCPFCRKTAESLTTMLCVIYYSKSICEYVQYSYEFHNTFIPHRLSTREQFEYLNAVQIYNIREY